MHSVRLSWSIEDEKLFLVDLSGLKEQGSYDLKC